MLNMKSDNVILADVFGEIMKKALNGSNKSII